MSVLTLVSMLKIWTGLFWGPSNTEGQPGRRHLRHHPLMSGVTVAVVGIGLVWRLAGWTHLPLLRAGRRVDRASGESTSTTVNGQAAGRCTSATASTRLGRLLGPVLLLVVWIALWGDLSWANVICGLIVVPVVTLDLGAPAARAHRVHPLGMAKFASSSSRCWSSRASPSPEPACDPRRNDCGPAWWRYTSNTRPRWWRPIVADAITLTPGTLTLDISPDSSTLYVHVLGIGDPDDVRADVADLERLVVGAVEPIETPIDRRSRHIATRETSQRHERRRHHLPRHARAVAALLTIGYLLRVRNLVDRAIGVDTVAAIFMSGLAVVAAVDRGRPHRALILMIGLLGFLGTVTVSRFIERQGL